MPHVPVRTLAKQASRIVAELVDTGRPVIVTKAGHPVAVMLRLAPGELEEAWLNAEPLTSRIAALRPPETAAQP